MAKMMKKMSAMKAMKAMKMAKMSAMKMKMAKKVSKIGKRRSVFSGKKVKTVGGLQKKDLKKNKAGKIVSIKSSAAGKKAYKRIQGWTSAVSKARKALGVKGFCAVGGKSAKGQALLKKARSLYKK
jgi:hypothetical protein